MEYCITLYNKTDFDTDHYENIVSFTHDYDEAIYLYEETKIKFEKQGLSGDLVLELYGDDGLFLKELFCYTLSINK